MEPIKIIIIGAGIVGNMLAILLKKQGHDVEVYEKADPPAANAANQKSINLALSARAKQVFSENGLSYPQTVPMHGRLIHTETGEENVQLYDERTNQYIESIGRAALNHSLYEQALSLGVVFHFNQKLESIDIAKQQATFESTDPSQPAKKSTADYEYLFGADGSNSKVGNILDKSWSASYTPSKKSDWVYQEYEIPAKDGEYQLSNPEQFHIWPGKTNGVFLIALPNADKTFTLTLFCNKKLSRINLNTLKKENDIAAIRKIIHALVPEQQRDCIPITTPFQQNPVSSIYQRNSMHWHEDAENPRICLVGDSAAGANPFLGIGMNTGVESAAILAHMFKSSGFNLKTYAQKRMLCTKAVQDASADNATTLNRSVVDADQNLKRILSNYLEASFPNVYIDSHSMYSFTLLPEVEVRFRELYQKNLISRLLNNLRSSLEEAAQETSELSLNLDEYEQVQKEIVQYREEIKKFRETHKDKILYHPSYADAPLPKVASQSGKFSNKQNNSPNVGPYSPTLSYLGSYGF